MRIKCFVKFFYNICMAFFCFALGFIFIFIKLESKHHFCSGSFREVLIEVYDLKAKKNLLEFDSKFGCMV